MSVTIRPAEQKDVVQIVDILRDLGWFAVLKSESMDESRVRIMRHMMLCLTDASHSVFVAEENETIFGYASVHWLLYFILAGPEGYVSELFVREEDRGRGIGARLLETVKAEGVKRGCSRLALINNRSRESYKRNFYNKQGWHERAEMANFILKLQ